MTNVDVDVNFLEIFDHVSQHFNAICVNIVHGREVENNIRHRQNQLSRIIFLIKSSCLGVVCFTSTIACSWIVLVQAESITSSRSLLDQQNVFTMSQKSVFFVKILMKKFTV